VLFAYADGCIDGCETGAAPNSYSAKASIARQSGGKGLYAEFDTTEAGETRACVVDRATRRLWPRTLSGCRLITVALRFRVTGFIAAPRRAMKSSSDTQRLTPPASTIAAAMWRCRPTLQNHGGELERRKACRATPSRSKVGSRVEPTGACLQPGVTAVVDPAGDASDTLAQHDITSVSMAEPEDQAGKLVFTLKVKNLSSIPAGWRWAVRFGAPQKPPAITGLENRKTGSSRWLLRMDQRPRSLTARPACRQ
jgi:hypothetical protein